MSKYKSKEFLSASESDADDSGSEAEEVPKKTEKKQKSEKAEKQKTESKKKDEPPAKKSKGASKSNDDDKDSWEIGPTRKVVINEFRGKKLIDIREYYDKDGKEMPGRKGISLNVQQWRNLMEIADEVDHALNKF